MAYEGSFKYPTMIIDGVITVVTNEVWAQKTLSTEDYIKWSAAVQREDAIWDQAESTGIVVKQPIFETVDGRNHLVGQKVTMTGDVASDSEYADFMRQYLADPNVIWPAGFQKPVH